MQITEIINPEFRAIIDQNRHAVTKELRNSISEGWYPVGDMAQRGREWVQIVVAEKKDGGITNSPKRGRPRKTEGEQE